MPTPPVMPMAESATSSLRWSRGMSPSHGAKAGRIEHAVLDARGLQRLRGSCDWMPRMPIQSLSRRTFTPRRPPP